MMVSSQAPVDAHNVSVNFAFELDRRDSKALTNSC
jgi:hypothetical protein